MNTSFRQIFVANTGTLLASGTTANLAIGQLGILVVGHGAYTPTVLPTYSTAPKIVIAQGTPDLSDFPAGAGILNQTKYSKEINGSKLTGWRARKAHLGQTDIVAVGFDGTDITKTLSAKTDETKYLYIRLTGQPIANIFPGERGIIFTVPLSMPCAADCDTTCQPVDCNFIADNLISKIKELKMPGGAPLVSIDGKRGYIRLSKLTSCDTPPSPTTVEYTHYCLNVFDAGDNNALGAVQAQYPSVTVTRSGRSGNVSTYTFTQPTASSAPAAFNNSDLTVVPNCAVCPSNYTYVAELFLFEVQIADLGNSAALTAARAVYGSTAIRINYEFGTSTYLAYSATNPNTWTPTAGDVVSFVGSIQNTCTLTTPVTTAWTTCGTCDKIQRTYVTTLEDTICGTTRLPELVALLGSGVTEVSSSDANCVRQYTINVLSDNCLEGDCGVDTATFTAPPAVLGAQWIATVESEGVGCVCGIKIEAAYENRKTKLCTFDAFPYQADGVHIEVSQHNPDYIDTRICDDDWPVTHLQRFAQPVGTGEYVIRLEKDDKGLNLQDFSVDPAVRLAEGYEFLTRPELFYDEYVLEFTIDYPSGGWSQRNTDKYFVHVFFPQGTGTAFENAINAYVTSARIGLPLVSI